MRNVIAISIGLIIAAAVLAQSGEPVLTSANPNKIQAVNVTNFPATQNVAGTVDVGNLPAVQQVAGQVEITNMPAAPARFEFVGVTTQPFMGGSTRVAMNQQCFADFPGSRICFSDEYVNTVAAPPVSDIAWIQVRVAATVAGTNAIYDPVGTRIEFEGDMTGGYDCWSWGSSSHNLVGAFVAPTGAVGVRRCDEVHAVACCAPV